MKKIILNNNLKMKLAIVGSRNFNDYDKFKMFINKSLKIWKKYPEEIISGGAKGADTLAENYGNDNNIPVTIFEAEWSVYGRSAGPIRNKLIIERATHIVAFPSRSGRGTQHSISLAKKNE